MSKQIVAIWRRVRGWPPGRQITLVVLALVVGRYGWVLAERPWHGRELAAAHAINLFFGTPQADSTGKHLTFVGTGEHGQSVFLVDTASGKKTQAGKVDRNGWGGDGSLAVWPWAPDDSAFVYTVGGAVNICGVGNGDNPDQVALPVPIESLAWLSAHDFVALGADHTLGHFVKGAGGKWTVEPALKAGQNGMEVLRSVGGVATASGEDATRGATADNAFHARAGAGWSAGRKALPAWLQYEFRWPAWAITQYTLVSSQDNTNSDPRDWQILGSNDGHQWRQLDARTNELFTSRGQAKEYRFLNRTPFHFYRLNITATAGGGQAAARVGRLELKSGESPDGMLASSENAPKEGVAKAFDGSISTKWYNDWRPPPWWLQYEFGGGAGWPICQYRLTSANDAPERDPKDWQLLGTDDGETWTVVDARTGEYFDRFQTKTYDIERPTPYRCYRLNIQDINSRGGGNLKVQLAELALMATNANGQLADVSQVRLPFNDAFSLTAISSNTIAWGNNNGLWTMSLAEKVPRLLLDFQTVSLTNAALRGLSYSKKDGQFVLDCDQYEREVQCRFDPANAGAGLRSIKVIPAVREVNGNVHHDWAGWQNLTAGTNQMSPEMVARLRHAHVDAYTMSADGRQLFMQGTISNEPSASIWQFDLASSTFRSVVPYADAPWPGVHFLHPVNDVILTEDGKYTIYLPPDFYRHSHRRYPLVLGNTSSGLVAAGYLGRLWPAALAECGAIVAMANRDRGGRQAEQWTEGIGTAYERIASLLPVDKKRVYLFAVREESGAVAEALSQWPQRWQGVVLFSPMDLPDLSGGSLFLAKPRVLVVTGELGEDANRYVEYQQKALKTGALVEVVVSAGEGPYVFGNAAQRQRVEALRRLVFEE